MDLSTVQPVLDWMAANPELSGLIVFLVAAGESLALVGIVVPGVVFMLGIGALVGLNAINLWQALFWATAGAIVGDWFSYWLGRHFDRQLRHIWPLSRYPKLIPRGEAFFKKHGGASVFFGRFVGPLRPIIPAVAGIMHMPQGRFYFINVVSAILWAPVVILPGVAFGESIQLASEVFGRLIILVVIAIVLAVTLGYLVKRLVSYALMETIETLGEYFGFRAAKENILSLSLMGILAVSIMVFVHRYDVQYQVLLTQKQAEDRQWWKSHWSKFSNLHLTHKSEYPITFQWWGTLGEIEQHLQQSSWIASPDFTVKSALNYILPDPKLGQLPIWPGRLFNAKEVLTYQLPGASENRFYVLRIWAANPLVDITQSQLWLGTVHSVNLFSSFKLMHVPIRLADYSESLSLLHSKLHSVIPQLLIEQKTYPNAAVTTTWNGEILLLENKLPDNHRVESSAVRNSSLLAAKLRQVGETGLYLKSIHDFQLLTPVGSSLHGDQGVSEGQKQHYQLRDGGLVVDVTYLNSGPADTGNSHPAAAFSTIVSDVRKRLEHVEGLQLLTIKGKPLSVQDGEGIHITAHYDMPPFGKQIDYHVLAASKGASTWIMASSTKGCDEHAKRRLQDMLASFTISTAN